MTIRLTDPDKQFQRIVILCAVIVAALAIYFYLDQRDDMTASRDARYADLAKARITIAEQHSLEALISHWGGAVNANASEAEGTLLHFLDESETKSGVHNPSFQRISSVSRGGLQLLSYEVAAEGPVAAAGTLMYQIESAQFPMRVDSVAIHPKSDGNEVIIHFRISTLCKSPAKTAIQPVTPTAEALP